MAHRVVVVSTPDTHKTYTQVGTIIHPDFINNDYPYPGLFIKNPTEHVIKLNPADQKSRHVTKSGSFALRKVMVSGAYYSRYVSKNEVKHLLYEVQCDKNAVLGLAVEICKHFPLFNRKDGAQENINKSECHIHFSSVKLNEGEIDDLNAMIDGIRCAQRLRDTPAEEMNTKDLAQEAIEIGLKSKNMSVEIVKGEQLKARGFGGIYAVAKGADRDGYRTVYLTHIWYKKINFLSYLVILVTWWNIFAKLPCKWSDSLLKGQTRTPHRARSLPRVSCTTAVDLV